MYNKIFLSIELGLPEFQLTHVDVYNTVLFQENTTHRVGDSRPFERNTTSRPAGGSVATYPLSTPRTRLSTKNEPRMMRLTK